MPGQTILGDKPYDFVPLASHCDREAIKGHNNFSKGTYSGKLYLTIKTLSPILINQGILGFNSDGTNLTNTTIRRAEKVVIPGSSIKGVIRSIAEAVSYSCAPIKIKERGSRDLSDALEKSNKTKCDGSNKELCPTCSIFGMLGNSMNYKGKIMFSEFSLSKGGLDYLNIPDLDSPFKNYPTPSDIFPPKSNFGNERLYYCNACDGRKSDLCKKCTKDNYYSKIRLAGKNRSIKFRGRKFYFHNLSYQEKGNANRSTLYEVIRKDSYFTGSLVFENLTENELGLLNFSLGLDKSFNPKLGYGKPAFYGSIEISLNSTEDLLSRYKKTSQKIDNEFIMSLTSNYYDSCDDELKLIISKLREILDKNKSPQPWPVVGQNKVY